MGGIWLVGTPFGLSGTSGERKGPPKGIFCPKRCLFGGPSSAVEVFEEAGAHDMDTAQPDGSASGSWAQIRPLGAAKGPPGPPKGPFWPKRAFLGAPGVQKWSLKGPKHMVWMRLTQLDQPVAVGPKTGLPRTSRAPKRVF